MAKTDPKLKYVLWLESDSHFIGDRLNVRSFCSDIIISVEAMLELMAKHNSKEEGKEVHNKGILTLQRSEINRNES